MCRPSRWRLGLLPLAALLLVALWWKTPQIEAEVAQNASAALAGQGVIDPSVAVSGRDARIGGVVIADQAAARAAAQDAAGVRLVADGLEPLAAQKPYVFAATRTGEGVTLTGAAPDPASRAAFNKAAAALGKVTDQMTYAAGAPKDYAAMTATALAAVAPLQSGSAAISDGALTVTGEARDAAGYEAARAAAQTPAAGMTLARFAVTAPKVSPYLFSASRAPGRVTLEGYAPDPQTRANLVAAARALAPQVEDRLVAGSGAPQGFEALAKAGLAALAPLEAGVARLSDTSLSLTGDAADAAARDKALAALRVPGATLAGADVATLTGGVFEARRDGASITLNGEAPSEAARQALVAQARELAPQVVDTLAIARGGPPDFPAAARAAMQGLRYVVTGEATLSSRALSVSGLLAPGQRASAATRAVAADLPATIAATYDWRYAAAAPFVFEARKAGSGAVTLSGFAPDEDALAALEARAREAGGPVTGAPALASGLAPQIPFQRSADLGLTLLGRLRSGVMRIDADGLSLTGEATQDVADAARAALARSGLKLGRVEIASQAPPAVIAPPVATAPLAAPPPPPPIVVPPANRPVDPVAVACRDTLLAELAQEHIEFATGSARIAARSEGLIRRLASVIKGCPDAALEIGGHTDNVGDPQANLKLSRERAEAVRKALADAGAPAARLSAEGYGETKPIVANDGADGRARNRRIDFTLK
jgi:OOP family OmpA-OmpF porin